MVSPNTIVNASARPAIHTSCKGDYHMKMLRTSTLVLVGLTITSGLLAQTAPHPHAHPAPKPASAQNKMMGGKKMGGMMGGGMMAHCMEMMKKRETMKSDMKAMDDKLTGLVATMNTASDADKSAAIVAVINEMIAQRKKSSDMMSSMQSGMMQHTMEHMQKGKQSMMMCPMMQGMHGTKNGASKPQDHSKHH